MTALVTAPSVTAVPPFDLVADVDTSGLRVAVVRAALEPDLLTEVARGAHDVPRLAAATRCTARGVRVLVRALLSLALLDGDEHAFEASATSTAYLVDGAPGDFRPILLSWLRNRDQLAELVRQGTADVEDHAGAGTADVWRSYAAVELVRWPDRVPVLTAAYAERGLRVPPRGRVLDLGCGSGIAAYALLRAEPTATAVCVDRPAVLDVARALAAAMDVDGRVALLAGDVRSVDLGHGNDVVLLGNVAQYLGDADLARLLARIGAGLAPGGVLHLTTVIPDAGARENAANWSAAVEMYLASPGVDQRDEGTLRAMLAGAGFAGWTGPHPACWSPRSPRAETLVGTSGGRTCGRREHAVGPRS